MNENHIRMDLSKISTECKNLNLKLENSQKYNNEILKKEEDFDNIFTESKNINLIKGLLCLAVLTFDFMVSLKSFLYLSDLLRIKVGFLALLFSLLDGGVAILASGGLAGANPHRKKRMQNTWRPFLVLLALIKLVLFTLYVYNTNIIEVEGEVLFQLTTSEMLKLLIPQTIFVIIIYLMLGIAGLGLWYIVGKIYYAILKLLQNDPKQIEKKLRDKLDEFKTTAEEYKIDFLEAIKEYGIESIYNKYIAKQNE